MNHIDCEKTKLDEIILKTRASIIAAFGSNYNFPIIFSQQVFAHRRSSNELVTAIANENLRTTLKAVIEFLGCNLAAIGLTRKFGCVIKKLCDYVGVILSRGETQ